MYNPCVGCLNICTCEDCTYYHKVEKLEAKIKKRDERIKRTVLLAADLRGQLMKLTAKKVY
jgi:hypothetical protein